MLKSWKRNVWIGWLAALVAMAPGIYAATPQLNMLVVEDIDLAIKCYRQGNITGSQLGISASQLTARDIISNLVGVSSNFGTNVPINLRTARLVRASLYSNAVTGNPGTVMTDATNSILNLDIAATNGEPSASNVTFYGGYSALYVCDGGQIATNSTVGTGTFAPGTLLVSNEPYAILAGGSNWSELPIYTYNLTSNSGTYEFTLLTTNSFMITNNSSYLYPFLAPNQPLLYITNVVLTNSQPTTNTYGPYVLYSNAIVTDATASDIVYNINTNPNPYPGLLSPTAMPILNQVFDVFDLNYWTLISPNIEPENNGTGNAVIATAINLFMKSPQTNVQFTNVITSICLETALPHGNVTTPTLVPIDNLLSIGPYIQTFGTPFGTGLVPWNLYQENVSGISNASGTSFSSLASASNIPSQHILRCDYFKVADVWPTNNQPGNTQNIYLYGLGFAQAERVEKNFAVAAPPGSPQTNLQVITSETVKICGNGWIGGNFTNTATYTDSNGTQQISFDVPDDFSVGIGPNAFTEANLVGSTYERYANGNFINLSQSYTNLLQEAYAPYQGDPGTGAPEPGSDVVQIKSLSIAAFNYLQQISYPNQDSSTGSVVMNAPQPGYYIANATPVLFDGTITFSYRKSYSSATTPFLTPAP